MKKNHDELAKQETKNPSETELTHDLPVFTPSTDIFEDENGIKLYADMPGVSPEKVDITLEDDVLTMTGKQCMCEPKEHELLHRGYNSGLFRRSFTLSTAIDQSKIEAKMNNGILYLTLPKAEKAKARKITVQAG